MPSPEGVEALLFDLGGVVLGIDFNRVFARWAAYSGERIDTIQSRFSFDSFYERHERGEIQAQEYFASLRSSLGLHLSDNEFAAGWTAIYVGEIPAMAGLLRRLKDRVPIYALTNSNPTHQQVWAKDYADILSVFRKVFVSSEMGKRKPEPEAFAAIATDIGVPLDRILFFDDTLENVEGARAIGMQAVHVQSVADIEHNLAGFLQ
jgi:epoxide hydrolase-like predicted phosphatase